MSVITCHMSVITCHMTETVHFTLVLSANVDAGLLNKYFMKYKAFKVIGYCGGTRSAVCGYKCILYCILCCIFVAKNKLLEENVRESRFVC